MCELGRLENVSLSHAHTHIYTNAYIHTHTNTYTQTQTHIYTCIHTDIHTHIYTYTLPTHTHMQTDTHPPVRRFFTNAVINTEALFFFTANVFPLGIET